MAIYVYGLAASDVTAEVPGLDAGSISATTEPVSTSDVTQWIEDAAGRLNAVMEKSGITPSATMDEEAHAALVEAIKAYAVSKILGVLGVTGAAWEQANNRWQQIYAEYSNRPQQLGDAYDGTLTLSIDNEDNRGVDSWSFNSNERVW